MAVRAINLGIRDKWQWDQDPDHGTDDATTFEFRPLSSYEQAHLNDRLTSMDGGMPTGQTEDEIRAAVDSAQIRTEVYRVAVEAVRIALVGVTNLQDENGEVIPWETAKMQIAGKSVLVAGEKIIAAIPVMCAMAGYRRIMEITTPGKAAAKNSAGASPQSS